MPPVSDFGLNAFIIVRFHTYVKTFEQKRYKKAADREIRPAVLAQREGFEPSCDCSQTDFEGFESHMWYAAASIFMPHFTANRTKNHGEIAQAQKRKSIRHASIRFYFGSQKSSVYQRYTPISKYLQANIFLCNYVELHYSIICHTSNNAFSPLSADFGGENFRKRSHFYSVFCKVLDKR